jgi:hypothetical protein
MKGALKHSESGSAEEQKSGVDFFLSFHPLFLTSALPIFAVRVRQIFIRPTPA